MATLGSVNEVESSPCVLSDPWQCYHFTKKLDLKATGGSSFHSEGTQERTTFSSQKDDFFFLIKKTTSTNRCKLDILKSFRSHLTVAQYSWPQRFMFHVWNTPPHMHFLKGHQKYWTIAMSKRMVFFIASILLAWILCNNLDEYVGILNLQCFQSLRTTHRF